MIAVLIGCSLRTVEAAALKLKEIQLREGQWVSADLNGKGGHIRTVPISSSSFWARPLFVSQASSALRLLYRPFHGS